MLPVSLRSSATLSARAQPFRSPLTLQCLSIIYGDDYKTLDLYMPNCADYNDW